MSPTILLLLRSSCLQGGTGSLDQFVGQLLSASLQDGNGSAGTQRDAFFFLFSNNCVASYCWQEL